MTEETQVPVNEESRLAKERVRAVSSADTDALPEQHQSSYILVCIRSFSNVT